MKALLALKLTGLLEKDSLQNMLYELEKETPAVYVVNFNDEGRKERMIERFDKVGYIPKFVNPVLKTDDRLKDVKNGDVRTWAVMLQHLDCLRDFYENTSKDYCVVCEDDIYIAKNFDIAKAINDFKELKLDVMLLGYLSPYKQFDPKYFKELRKGIYSYPDDLWGSQMYLVSRDHAKYLLDTYTIRYALKDSSRPFSPDWILTKVGKRALVSPMLAVEEGNVKTDNQGQIDFHKKCFEVNYNKDSYI